MSMTSDDLRSYVKSHQRCTYDSLCRDLNMTRGGLYKRMKRAGITLPRKYGTERGRPRTVDDDADPCPHGRPRCAVPGRDCGYCIANLTLHVPTPVSSMGTLETDYAAGM